MNEQFEIEAAVLILAVRNAEAREILLASAQPEWFTELRHQHVFDAIRKLHSRGLPVDMAGVKRETALKEPIDTSWFEQASFLARGMNHESYQSVHIPALREAYQVRALAAISGDLCERAMSEAATSQELLSWLDGKLQALRAGESVEVNMTQESALIGSTGARDVASSEAPRSRIDELDSQGLRFESGRVTTIAARPKNGKTALVGQVAISLSGYGPVALFNLEMGQRGWKERRIPQIAKVDFETYALGKADDWAYEAVSLYEHYAKERGLYIIEPASCAMTASMILAQTRKMRREGIPVQFVVVDQMQQIADWESTRKGEGRDQQPTRIVKELVAGCRALGVHLVMVHQLSRAADNRRDKEPILADLAEAAVFERISDQILFVYRPNFDIAAGDDAPPDDFGIIKRIGRYGGNFRARVSWDGNLTKFGTWGDPVMAQVYEHRRQRRETEAV
jgi:replicative DNA helicase